MSSYDNSGTTSTNPSTTNGPVLHNSTTEISQTEIKIKPAKKVVINAEPATSGPMSVASNTTKTSASSKGALKVNTCCGVVELTPMKLACLIGMAITVVAFVALGVISITSFVFSSSKKIDLLITYADIRYYRSQAMAYVKMAAYSNDYNQYFQLYTSNNNNLSSLITTVTTVFKDDAKANSLFTKTTLTAKNTLDGYNTQVFALLTQGAYQQDAIDLVNSQIYKETDTKFYSGLTALLSYVVTSEQSKDSSVIASNLVQLIIIVIALVIVLPVLVFVFTYAINRDSLYLEKIRRANSIMLLDTIADTNLRSLFKAHCEKEKSVENYLLLEKIHTFKSMCEKVDDLSMKLYGDSTISDTASASSKTDSTATAESSVPKLKKEQVAKYEKEMNETETKKYELAFEIYSDHLDINGDLAANVTKSKCDKVKVILDQYNTKQVESLPLDLFKQIEKEVCLTMMDTHSRFKSSIAFQKEMKIHKLNVEKIKAKHKNKF